MYLHIYSALMLLLKLSAQSLRKKILHLLHLFILHGLPLKTSFNISWQAGVLTAVPLNFMFA